VWNYGISQAFGKSNYFDFVSDDKKKIAYGASFGHGIDFAPKGEQKIISNLKKRFDAISVREKQGVDLARDNYGVRATQVLDPVFLPEKKIYEKLARKSRLKEKGSYIITYILDPTPEKREAMLHVSDKLGLRLVNMLDGMPMKLEDNKKKMALEVAEDVQFEEWLYLIKNSEFVITDSFHGMTFATIFCKTFIPIVNKSRGYSRFKSFVDMLGIPERLMSDPKSIIDNPLCLEPMDFKDMNKKLEENILLSKEWLGNALKSPKGTLPTVTIPQKAVPEKLDEKMCTGCSACTNICPSEALRFQEDTWGYYRSKVDFDACLNCGKCATICPALKLPKKQNKKNPVCYAIIAADEEILHSSSSGGFFTLISEIILEQEGYVVGASWTEDFSVKHIMIGERRELSKLQKSKYLQSYLGNIFAKIKEKLENNNTVLFTGTPCQVAGLKSYLGQEYENLLLIDLLCGNSPSPMFFKKYLEDSFPEGVREYEFRYKGRGWNSDCIKVVLKDDSSTVLQGEKDDDYQRVYHNHTMCPPHCEDCKYQKVPRYGDFTIGDFWGIGKRDSSMVSDKGVSVVLCNNDKAEKFIEQISKKSVSLMKKVPLHWLGGNGYAINDSQNYCSPGRDAFYEAIKTMPFSNAVDYALKPNHGIYNKAHEHSNTPLQFSTSFSRFSFDKDVWEEHLINGVTVLLVKPGMWNELGRYAVLSLCKPLTRGKKFELSVRFRIKTMSEILNFHIKDSGSKQFQIIKSFEIPPNFLPEDWIELTVEFTPNSKLYDEFMIGASHVSGTDNYIAFDYINIREVVI
jgi:coenzyme F420-reducing hydrogenase beta subunit